MNNDSIDILSKRKHCELFTHQSITSFNYECTVKSSAKEHTKSPKPLIPFPNPHMRSEPRSNTPVPGAPPKTAARSFHVLRPTQLRHNVPHLLQCDAPHPPQNCPFRLKERHPNQTLPILGATRSTTPNGISIASTIASQYATQTDRQTKPMTCPYALCDTATLPK